MAYTIELARRAQKQLAKIPIEWRRRLAAIIDALAENPKPSGSAKMQGIEKTYRLRVGDYRILYEIEDRRLIIYVLRIAHRRDVYR